jgi:YidC/Oxa1 family membrane protein insertase
MLSYIWNAFLYNPLVNILALLVALIPGENLGLAIILLTIVVKIILLPLSKKTMEGQAKQKLLQPEIDKIKKSGKSKEEQARLTFDLYKKHKANPFSGCLVILIQLPIIFALYRVFYKGLNFDPEALYSWVQKPNDLNTLFLGIDISLTKNYLLAILAGASQFVQARFMPVPKTSSGTGGQFGENFAKSMQTNMKYVFPFVVVFISYSLSGAIVLYWITSNIFGIFQQLYINKRLKVNDLSIKDAKYSVVDKKEKNNE